MSGTSYIFIFCIFFLSTFNLLNAQDTAVIIADIEVQGNRTTRTDYILEKLPFNTGDTLSVIEFESLIREAQKNLERSSLFLKSELDYRKVLSEVFVMVEVKERWYYWLYPILEHADRNLSAFLYAWDRKRINYGASFEKHNLTGNGDLLKIKFRKGFREQYGGSYFHPGLMGDNRHGLGFSAFWYHQKNLALSFDERAMPHYYFNEDRYALSEKDIILGYAYRPDQNSTFKLLASYQFKALDSSVNHKYENYLPGQDSENEFLSLRATFRQDARDNAFQPHRGWMAAASVEQKGLGVFSAYSQTALEAETDVLTPIGSRLTFRNSFYGKVLLDHARPISFDESRMLGYAHYLRGYEYYIIHGEASCLLQNEMAFTLVQKDWLPLPFIPVFAFDELPYQLDVFTFLDFGKVWNAKGLSNQNFLSDRLLMSFGLGCRLMTWYDRNIDLHMAWTNEKAFGIFVAYNTPIYNMFK